MKKLIVNTEIISKWNPCKDRFDNWLKHYKDFDGDAIEFLSLDKITPQDKIWVTLRLLRDDNDLFTLQVFAIDCAFAAAYAAAAAADATAAYTVATAATAYTATATAAADAADAATAAAYAATATAYVAYAAAYADATAASDAASDADAAASDAAADAASATATATAAAERERQIDCLIYLISNRGEL